MNKLKQMRQEYESGACEKHSYIENIHALHTLLFDYKSFIEDTDIESINITSSGIFVRSRTHQTELLLDATDQHLVPYAVMNFHHYETQETNFLKSIANDNWTILDIGANCGWYSLALGRKFPNARIHAFEPIRHTFDILKKNIERNELSNNITAHPIGVSNQEGFIDFLYTPECSGATSLKLAGHPKKTHSELQNITCPITTLDVFCRENAISPQLIKCDVEGAELMVIQGGIHTIASCRPVLLIELLRKWAKKFDYHPNSVIDILDQLGYAAYTLRSDTLVRCPEITEHTQETNFIFLHNEEHQEIINEKSCRALVK